MPFSEELINQVVANVLSTISRQGHGRQATGSVPPVSSADSSVTSSVVLSEKVITAELLAEKVKGQSAVGLTAGAILTPSAKDYLRQFQINVHRSASVASPQSESGTQWRAIVVSHSVAVENALKSIEQQTSSRWSQELSTSLEEAVKDATSSLCRADATGVVPLYRSGRESSLSGESK